ncbi:YiiD C-terminal domain-containing protein [Marinospirillum sp. MEB164]|uniref:YiiD C-terminal domain-containing protein n=1 Tax=Marinospirillum alkalitolerans TaxID=3123374 RepID=A0ABW8PYZ3_9GAMM
MSTSDPMASLPVMDATFLEQLHQQIPLTQAMGIQQLGWEASATSPCLTMHLALAPLVNDKGTAFGGGVVGLATLLGWCWTRLMWESKQPCVPVVVKSAQQTYLAPIEGDFTLRAQPLHDDWVETLDPQQSARPGVELVIEAWQGEHCCFRFQGVYRVLAASRS